MIFRYGISILFISIITLIQRLQANVPIGTCNTGSNLHLKVSAHEEEEDNPFFELEKESGNELSPPRKLLGKGPWIPAYREVAGQKIFVQYRPRTRTSNCRSGGKGNMEVAVGPFGEEVTDCNYLSKSILDDLIGKWDNLPYFNNQDTSKPGALIYFPSSKLSCQNISFIAISSNSIAISKKLNVELIGGIQKLSIRVTDKDHHTGTLCYNAASPEMYKYLLANDNIAVSFKLSNDLKQDSSIAFLLERKKHGGPFHLYGVTAADKRISLKHVQIDVESNQLICYHVTSEMSDIYEKILIDLPAHAIQFLIQIIQEGLLEANKDSIVIKRIPILVTDVEDYTDKDERLGLEYNWHHQVRNGLPKNGPLKLSYRRLKPNEILRQIDYQGRHLVDNNEASTNMDKGMNAWEIVMQDNPYVAIKVTSEETLKVYLVIHHTADAIIPVDSGNNRKACIIALEMRRMICHDRISGPILSIKAKYDPLEPNSMLIKLFHVWYKYNYSASSEFSQTPYDLLFRIGPMQLEFPLESISAANHRSPKKAKLILKRDGINQHVTAWLNGEAKHNLKLDMHHSHIISAPFETTNTVPQQSDPTTLHALNEQRFLLKGGSNAAKLLNHLITTHSITKITTVN